MKKEDAGHVIVIDGNTSEKELADKIIEKASSGLIDAIHVIVVEDAKAEINFEDLVCKIEYAVLLYEDTENIDVWVKSIDGEGLCVQLLPKYAAATIRRNIVEVLGIVEVAEKDKILECWAEIIYAKMDKATLLEDEQEFGSYRQGMYHGIVEGLTTATTVLSMLEKGWSKERIIKALKLEVKVENKTEK